MSRRSGGQAIGRGRGQKGKQQKGRHGEDELGRLEEEGLAEEKQEKERKKDGQELDNATYGVMSGRSSLTLVENQPSGRKEHSTSPAARHLFLFTLNSYRVISGYRTPP